MKVILESTTKIVTVNNVPARIWEGSTGTGVPVYAFITRIATPEGGDLRQFEQELQQCRVPSPEVVAIPARLVL